MSALLFNELSVARNGSPCTDRDDEKQFVGWAKGAQRRAHRLVMLVGTRSLSSGAHSRDPLALPTLRLISDTRSQPRDAKRPSCAQSIRPTKGVGNAGCPLHPQPRAQR
jgi:hypothetical protein